MNVDVWGVNGRALASSRKMVPMKLQCSFPRRVRWKAAALLFVQLCAAQFTNAASVWASLTLKNNDAVIVENSPELLRGYCFVHGHFGMAHREFSAASKAREGSGGKFLCKKGDFPNSYFFIQKEVELVRLIDVLNVLKARIWSEGANDVSAEVDAAMSGGMLRWVDYLSLNSRPWVFLFCAEGSLFDHDSCKSISLSLTPDGRVSSIAISDVLN